MAVLTGMQTLCTLERNGSVMLRTSRVDRWRLVDFLFVNVSINLSFCFKFRHIIISDNTCLR